MSGTNLSVHKRWVKNVQLWKRLLKPLTSWIKVSMM
ncbi:uncharacterized protein METZ01_LOCUS290176 [marine metagenome]|uniref:Uncharacterized protein n=1 Tax=marine metagenome TaxID=408172 RepID=A0A382LQG5_9ZZZZ